MSLDAPSAPAPEAVEVRTPARIHIGMLSFGHAGRRAYGGVGVMLDRPGVVLRAWRSPRFEARGPLADRALQFARQCAVDRGGGPLSCTIEVVSAPRSHVGLGSGTQLGLAVAAAIDALAAVPDAADPGQCRAVGSQPPRVPRIVGGERRFGEQDAVGLARVSGRGRRSCVGVYGFGGGGLIVEAGRAVTMPSVTEDDATRAFSPLVARVHLPEAWRCVLLIRRDAVGLHGEAERAAFGALPPMACEVSAELARIALLELVPAASEGRFAEFSDAVRRYGRLAGLPFEPAAHAVPHAAATTALLDALADMGAPGAQSSWGPAVMACCDSSAAARSLVERLGAAGIADDHDVTIARFDSVGATLRVLA
jgi:predicted sugar kinase